jgi:hypothetical protein
MAAKTNPSMASRIGLVVLLLSAPIAACVGTTTPVCQPGRINVDGVCANELVADYVACVRAQGAQLGEDKSRRLSADAAYAAVKASAVAEAKDTLEKKYSASDAAVLEIVRMCSTVAREGAARERSGTTSPVEATRAQPAGDGAITRSEDTKIPVQVRFVNRRREPVTVVWIDFAGGERSYGTIASGAELPMDTYVRHLWVFRLSSGAEVWRWHAESGSVSGAIAIP